MRYLDPKEVHAAVLFLFCMGLDTVQHQQKSLGPLPLLLCEDIENHAKLHELSALWCWRIRSVPSWFGPNASGRGSGYRIIRESGPKRNDRHGLWALSSE